MVNARHQIYDPAGNVQFFLQVGKDGEVKGLGTTEVQAGSKLSQTPAGNNKYPRGSKIYFVKQVDPYTKVYNNGIMETRSYEKWHRGVYEAGKIGEIYYGHNQSLSGIIDTTNINDWQHFYRSFYSYTHADQIRGHWYHDTNWGHDMLLKTTVGGSGVHALSASYNPEASAGWGYLRYGGYDHKQYNLDWETAHMPTSPGGALPPPSAIGFTGGVIGSA